MGFLFGRLGFRMRQDPAGWQGSMAARDTRQAGDETPGTARPTGGSFGRKQMEIVIAAPAADAGTA
ncbi:hypothetical protein GCM10011505_44640 [Tistrella bauzanensis]|uniref:Uncharacterized protein n=1 Tax=Tistrella bauzanensis TaxID=657419 RepID=A0ABQ1J3A2_9PROT|nr:hypothetical protein GCM10011505_44640 [Tistrella bauzanensis]